MDHWSDLVLKHLSFFHHFLWGILPIKVCNVIWVNSLIFIGFCTVLSWGHWQINWGILHQLNLILGPHWRLLLTCWSTYKWLLICVEESWVAMRRQSLWSLLCWWLQKFICIPHLVQSGFNHVLLLFISAVLWQRIYLLLFCLSFNKVNRRVFITSSILLSASFLSPNFTSYMKSIFLVTDF